MKLFSKRFPPGDEILKAFWVTIVGANFAAFFIFFYNFSAFQLKYTLSESMLLLAYILSYAILEAGFSLFLLLLLAMFFRRLRGDFSVWGSVIYVHAIVFLYPWIGQTSAAGFFKIHIFVSTLPYKWVLALLWCVLLGFMIHFLIKIFSNQTNVDKFKKFIVRVTLLGQIYFFMDCISAAIIIIRLLK